MKKSAGVRELKVELSDAPFYLSHWDGLTKGQLSKLRERIRAELPYRYFLDDRGLRNPNNQNLLESFLDVVALETRPHQIVCGWGAAEEVLLVPDGHHLMSTFTRFPSDSDWQVWRADKSGVVQKYMLPGAWKQQIFQRAQSLGDDALARLRKFESGTED